MSHSAARSSFRPATATPPPGTALATAGPVRPLLAATISAMPLLLGACDPRGLVAMARPLPGPPALQISSTTHDFGTLQVGEQAELQLTLRNAGTGPLTVHELRWAPLGEDMSIEASPALDGPFPWSLGPGEGVRLRVHYQPSDAGPDQGRLFLRTDDPTAPDQTLRQLGQAIVGASRGWHTRIDTRVPIGPEDDVFLYEPSGTQGLLDPADPAAAALQLRNHTIQGATEPRPIHPPLQLWRDKLRPRRGQATFTTYLTDLFIPQSHNPADYTLHLGRVDDALLVLLDGQRLARFERFEQGAVSLGDATRGGHSQLVLIHADWTGDKAYLRDVFLTHKERVVRR